MITNIDYSLNSLKTPFPLDEIKPQHYNGTECLDIIQSMCKKLPGDEAAIMSHIVKYEFRYPDKGATPAEQLKDLQKDYEYYGYLIKLFKEKHNV